MPQFIPTRSKLVGLMAGSPGPVVDPHTARQYLHVKGLIIDGINVNRARLIDVLFTALTAKIPGDVSAAIRAVAFLLASDTADKVSSLMAAVIADKVTAQLKMIANGLSSGARFSNASSTWQASATADLQAVAIQITEASKSISEASAKIMAAGPLAAQPLSQWPLLRTPSSSTPAQTQAPSTSPLSL